MIGREKQPGEKEKEMSRGGLGKKDQEKVCIDTSFSIETLIHQMHQSKWVILDPSDL
jgi:hypothetical protein